MPLTDFLFYLYLMQNVVLLLYGIPHLLGWVQFPKVFVELFQYGKTRGKKNVQSSLVKMIELPKSWFVYFYAYGLILSLYMVVVTTGTYFLGKDIPGVRILKQVIGETKSSNDAVAAFLVTAMMLVQHSRRLYECLFVSVYSKGTMNILHFLMGITLYSTVQLTALAESPKLNYISAKPITTDVTDLFKWNRVIGVTLFLLASYEHNRAHVILANLRKDRSGSKVIHRQHIIPRGRLFEYVASPHFTMEILIYLSMAIVVWGNCTFFTGPVLFVIVNQTLMAKLSHNWYRKTFGSKYPTSIKAVIPFIF